MRVVASLGMSMLAVLGATACSSAEEDSGGPEGQPSNGQAVVWDRQQGPSDRLATIEGLSGPEAVRYDPDQDVWFIANFGPGSSEERDGDGFITRVDAATGSITGLRFAEGTDVHPLHMPRGMFLTGDTLWVADVDGVHGFDRGSGVSLVFHDFSALEPGFLNDLAAGPDGVLYVTDTGRSALFDIVGGAVTEVLADTALGHPNGVTWDPVRESFVLVPWEPGHAVRLWRPGETTTSTLGEATTGRLDGVEALGGMLLIASQTDSALHVRDAAGSRPVVRVAGAPADIGIDTRRNRVAVPYIDLDRVDIWQLPDDRE
jgi:hypothetical protein